jgi:hypothetical protein
MTTFHRSFGTLCCVLTLCAASARAHPHAPAEAMAEAAQNFLAALTPEQRQKATFDLNDAERVNWHFVPRERKGLPFKEMTPAQRHLAHALLSTGLSHRGYVKATTIMSLEQILRDLEQGRGPTRDPELYFVTIFGQPGARSTWGWRVEGHHLSVNFTLANGHAVSAPTFFGSNPAEVKTGPRQGLRVLAEEEDLARALVSSLSEAQRQQAIIQTDAPRDIITGADRKARRLEPLGIGYAALNPEQQQRLRALVEAYAQRHRLELAAQDLEQIQQAGWDQVHFAWAGSLERGQGHYYRVQGPTFLLEYDNTQNDANHIHSVWRDLANDFGEDLLRKHYQETPHGK